MRITILVHCFSGGGAERVAALWAKGFLDRGYKVSVITYKENRHFEYKLPDEVEYMRIVSNKKSKFSRTIDRMKQLRSIVKSVKPDVVIDVMPDWWKIISLIGLDCKKISTEHSSFDRPDCSDIKSRRIYLDKLYDYVTVLTQADKTVIGNKLKHVAVLANPLALQPVGSIPPKENIILAVGRLDAWEIKGFDVLIKAWKHIYQDAPGWILQIAGRGTEENKKRLKRLCIDAGIGDIVIFVGHQTDIQSYYSRASVFVLSSRCEGFGLVLIEAMSQGCACVACDYKGRQREIIIQDDEGIICNPGNYQELGNAILSLIKNEKKRRLMAENGLQRSKHYCIENIMEKWEEILKEIQ